MKLNDALALSSKNVTQYNYTKHLEKKTFPNQKDSFQGFEWISSDSNLLNLTEEQVRCLYQQDSVIKWADWFNILSYKSVFNRGFVSAEQNIKEYQHNLCSAPALLN